MSFYFWKQEKTCTLKGVALSLSCVSPKHATQSKQNTLMHNYTESTTDPLPYIFGCLQSVASWR